MRAHGDGVVELRGLECENGDGGDRDGRREILPRRSFGMVHIEPVDQSAEQRDRGEFDEAHDAGEDDLRDGGGDGRGCNLGRERPKFCGARGRGYGDGLRFHDPLEVAGSDLFHGPWLDPETRRT
jgi:hypothetical protein